MSQILDQLIAEGYTHPTKTNTPCKNSLKRGTFRFLAVG